MKTLLLSLAMIFMAHADNSTDARPKTKKQKESITKIKDIKQKRISWIFSSIKINNNNTGEKK